MKRLSFILCLVLLAASPLKAVPIHFDGPAGTVPQYGRADFDITLSGNWSNPYLQEEVTLDLVLTAPSGALLRVPCFYVGGEGPESSRWAARFTPQEKGVYTYCFTCTESGKETETSIPGQLRVGPPKGEHGILHVRDNWTLVYDDGTLFRGIGENICWESRTEDDSRYFKALHERHERYNYPVMLPALAAAGGNFTRMWMCSWNFPIDRHRDFNNSRYEASEEYFNPSAVRRLDEVITLAEQEGIRIMLCMGPGDVPTGRDFFISAEAKARYRNYLRYIVARWGYSPSVAMWEFFNEIDNIQFRRADKPIPAEEIVAWHAEMAAYLKGLDPFGHIVTTSISHRDLEGLNDIADIDINQKHIYCATSDIPGTIRRYEKEHGKPYVIGEFGYEWDWSKNFDDFAGDMDADFRRGLWYGLFSPTPVTPMSWWWEWFDRRGLMSYFRHVRTVSDRMLLFGKGAFEPVKARADGCDAYAVCCGKRTYVYIYNPGPGKAESVAVSLSDGRRASTYDWTAGSFGPATCIKARGGRILLTLALGPKEEALFEIR